MLAALAVAAALAATRWPLAPKHLFSFDSVNFALALREFNPLIHQPQPPGYPFYVGLTRLLHLVVGRPEHVFLLAGLLGATAALICLWLLGDEMYGAGAGFVAALLLLFNPVFWYAGLTNQVRVFLATCACATALCAWRAWRRGSPGRWLGCSALALGIGAGFRPAAALLLLPLLAATAYRRRSAPREALAVALLLGLSVASWLGILLYAAGGWQPFWRSVLDYSQQQFAGTSLLFGSGGDPAARMAKAAVIWNGLGVITWIWAAPLVLRKPSGSGSRKTAPFLLCWFLPGFLFSAIVHVGDPDHTLLTVPALCLAGAKVLTDLRTARWRGAAAAWRWATVMAVGLNILLFLRPGPGLARAPSHRTVRAFDRQIHSAWTAVRQSRAAGPVVVVSCPSFMSWRHLSYYFPDVPLFRIDPGGEKAGVALMGAGQAEPATTSDGRIILPPARRVVVVLAPWQELKGRRGDGRPLRRQGPLVPLDAEPNLTFELEKLRFSVSPVHALDSN